MNEHWDTYTSSSFAMASLECILKMQIAFWIAQLEINIPHGELGVSKNLLVCTRKVRGDLSVRKYSWQFIGFNCLRSGSLAIVGASRDYSWEKYEKFCGQPKFPFTSCICVVIIHLITYKFPSYNERSSQEIFWGLYKIIFLIWKFS